MDILLIEKFFQDDLKAKKIIEDMKVVTSEQMDYARIKCVDDMLKKLNELQDVFIEMINIARINIPVEKINYRFLKIEDDVIKCYNDLSILNDTYIKYVLSMSNTLEKSLQENIKGYYMFTDYAKPFDETKSLNDILHLIHFSFINKEGIYNSNIIDSYSKDYKQINLVGRDNVDARNIYNNLIKEENTTVSAKLDILGLNNSVIIMARDLGHATVIEIEKEEDSYRVKYFIPKVCNPIKANLLPGVNKLKENSEIQDPTTGEFVIKEDLANNIIDFIRNIPTDNDMDEYLSLRQMLEEDTNSEVKNRLK